MPVKYANWLAEYVFETKGKTYSATPENFKVAKDDNPYSTIYLGVVRTPNDKEGDFRNKLIELTAIQVNNLTEFAHQHAKAVMSKSKGKSTRLCLQVR